MSRKAKAAAAAAVSLPAGFRQVTTGSFPQNHDFKTEAELIGTVTEIKTTPQRRGKKVEDVKILYVANNDGEIRAVWESASLEGLFAEVEKGDRVYIRFDGIKKLKGKKTLKAYTAAIAPKSKKGK